MSDLPLKIRLGNALNEAGREGATNADPPLDHSQPSKEAEHMIHCDHYGDSTSLFNQSKSGTWQSVGDLARDLVKKARGARQ